MSPSLPRVLPVGDRGLLVEFAPDVSPETSALVLGAASQLGALPGVVETIPTFRSVLIVYSPLAVRFDEIAARAEACARRAVPAAADAGRLVEVPVVYGGASGPDLDAVAAACSLPAAEVVRLHSEPTYVVFMLGFAPGHPYLGMLPSHLRLPRRASPRLRVPAGSVAVADLFTCIYSLETAGGWHLLGRTPMQVFDPHRSPPFLIQPGDRVRFVPIRDAPDVAVSAPAAAADLVSPRRPVFEVLQPGLMSTVQDLGRTGWRRYGIPSSGALDRRACAAANLAVGNHPASAALELTFPGPKLKVLDGTQIAIAGADLDARLSGVAVDRGEAVRVRPGDVIDFEVPGQGQWAYLSVAGGIDVPEEFGSRSTYARGGLGGLHGRPLRAGDVLGRGEGACGSSGIMRPDNHGRSGPIGVIMGPQADAFTVEAQAALLSQPFEVTVQRDRSGMRLRGPALTHRRSAEILSDGLLPGAIQVPAEGQPIIIMADGPTTGGYTTIATVVDADLDRLAQAAPGTTIRFEAASVDSAHTREAARRMDPAGDAPRASEAGP